MKTNVYIDGFNLYYGSVKSTPYKWLNLAELSRRLLPQHQINRIRYFTARVKPRPSDPGQPQRQATYIRALRTIPHLSVHYGVFLSRPVHMPVANPGPGAATTVQVVKTEEKGSDVNLATYLLLDAMDGDFELAAIISNDSDLAEPIRQVRARFGLPVVILYPTGTSKRPRSISKTLLQVASGCKAIRPGVLKASQFAETLTDAKGRITKPASL